MNDVRFLDSRIKLLEEEVTGLQEQLESYREALERVARIAEDNLGWAGRECGKVARAALASNPATSSDRAEWENRKPDVVISTGMPSSDKTGQPPVNRVTGADDAMGTSPSKPAGGWPSASSPAKERES